VIRGALVVVLLVVAQAIALAGDRDADLGAIQDLARERKPTKAVHEKLRDLGEKFLEEYPGDEDAPMVRLRVGLAHAALGEDEKAAGALAAVTATARPGSDFRMLALYSLGQVQIGLGEADAARRSLGAVVEESPKSKLAERSRADLKDLEWIGRPAPEAAAGAHVVKDFASPFHPPAVPRTYVVDGDGIVRAAGVRGAAVERALKTCRPSR
jgi:hypothetical protein